MPNIAPGKTDNQSKISLGESVLKYPGRPAITTLSLIIVAFFCAGPHLLSYLFEETQDPDQKPDAQLTAIPLTSTISVFNQFECLPQIAFWQTGEVVNVIDGDTIDVHLDNGKTYRVRYIGMDTPERDDLFYVQSTAKNKNMVEGKTVTLIKDVSETDRFNRLLRYVLVDEMFVNYELVIQGYAQAVTYPPDVACQTVFQAAERSARENNIGLWSYQATSTP